MADRFADHVKSKSHEDRVAAASAAMVDKLHRIAMSGSDNHGLLMSFSEAMGAIYGVAAYYKTLGMKRHAELVFKDVAEYVQKP